LTDGVTVTVRGKDRLFAKLRKLAPSAAAELKVANEQAAVTMVGYARDFAPVKTGALRDSIVATPPGGLPPDHSQGNRMVPEGSWMVTAGNNKVRYAHLVEFGTHPHVNAGMFAGSQNPGMSAQPFFWPSYRLIRKSMKSRATRALKKSIKAVTG
jgi:HK97 gp10 family phage protein